MLYIVYNRRQRERGFTEEATWHVGEKVPKIRVADIVQIQADGDEANHIRVKAPGLCIDSHFQRYYGDLARTIYLNL